jgi:hypothetical protein
MALFRFGRKPATDTPEAPAESGAADAAAEGPARSGGGLLDRLRAGLAKTAKVLNTDVRDLFKREGRLVDEEFLEELRATLIRTDMGPAAAEAIVVDVRERLRARVVDPSAAARPARADWGGCGHGQLRSHGDPRHGRQRFGEDHLDRQTGPTVHAGRQTGRPRSR